MNFIRRPWFPIVLVGFGLSACAHLEEADSPSSQNLDSEPRFNQGRATGGTPAEPSSPPPTSTPSTSTPTPTQQPASTPPPDPLEQLKNVNPQAEDDAPVTVGSGEADSEEMADTTAAPPATEPEELPYGIPVPGRPGTVYSPYDRTAGFVDVSGLAPGTVVTDPYTGNQFRVP